MSKGWKFLTNLFDKQFSIEQRINLHAVEIRIARLFHKQFLEVRNEAMPSTFALNYILNKSLIDWSSQNIHRAFLKKTLRQKFSHEKASLNLLIFQILLNQNLSGSINIFFCNAINTKSTVIQTMTFR